MSFRSLLVASAVASAMAIALAAPAAARDKIRGEIPPQQAQEFVGYEGTVCGKVDDAKYAANSEGEPTMLYMGGAFPKHAFSARIWGKNRAEFDPAPETLVGKLVCVSGEIRSANQRAEVILSSPRDMQVR